MIDELKYRMMFFDADAGGGEGGGGGEGTTGGEGSKGAAVFDAPSLVGPAKSTTGTQEPPTGGEGDEGGKGGSGTGGAGTGAGEGGEGAGKAPADAGGFDADKFAKSFGDVIGEHLKSVAPKEPAAPPMTKEEAQKLLKVWTPTKEWVTKFDNLETREAALAEMRDGLIVQADTLAQLRMNELSDRLMEKIGPQLKMVEQYQNAQRDERFNTAYPQLANPKLQPLIRAVADDLIAQGKRFTSEQEAFKALAGGVEAVIKVSNPEFKLTAGSSPADNNNGREGNSIPVTSPGSRGTVGAQGRSSGPVKPRGLQIFDK